MPNENTQIRDLEAKVTRLQSEVQELSSAFYRNNFSSSQVFNKASVFTERLQVPVFSSAPAVGEVGDLIAVAGELFICTTAGDVASPATFTLVGSQT